MNKGFIFDWSGTLMDNFHCFCEVCDNIFRELGREPVTPEEIKQNFTIPYMKFWNKYLPGITIEKEKELYNKYIHLVDETKIFKDSLDTIKYLDKMGYQIFVVSSDPISKLIPEIEKSGLEPYFLDIVGDVHEKNKSIMSIVSKYSLDTDKSYYIGDTSGDIEAGKFANLKTIGITTGYQSAKKLSLAKPEYVVNSLSEIIKIESI